MRLAILVACSLLGARCGSSTRAEPEASAPADAAPDAAPDATAALDAGQDGGPYDCESACSREPPLCAPPAPGSCLELCRYFADTPGCGYGENQRLLRCLEENPGACEELPLGECWSEHNCFNYCTDPSSEYWCRPTA